jgi:hypothetical protein
MIVFASTVKARPSVFDADRIRAPRPSRAGKQQMVEAGGQLTRSFRCGLDYAFILDGHPASMRSVLSGGSKIFRPDPSARPEPRAFSASL